jgi:hypothetical protein
LPPSAPCAFANKICIACCRSCGSWANYSIPIAENINLFFPSDKAFTEATKSGTALYTLWSYGTDLTYYGEIVGYGVVIGRQAGSDYSKFSIDMRSNIRVEQYAIWATGMRSLNWGGSNTPGYDGTIITDWSPIGSSSVSSDGLTVNVKAKMTNGLEVGTNFTLFQKTDTITGFAQSAQFDLTHRTSYPVTPNYVLYSNAAVTYANQNYSFFSWFWQYSWNTY